MLHLRWHFFNDIFFQKTTFTFLNKGCAGWIIVTGLRLLSDKSFTCFVQMNLCERFDWMSVVGLCLTWLDHVRHITSIVLSLNTVSCETRDNIANNTTSLICYLLPWHSAVWIVASATTVWMCVWMSECKDHKTTVKIQTYTTDALHRSSVSPLSKGPEDCSY